MKIIVKSLAAAVALSFSCFSMAEIAVIVHPSASFNSMTEDDIARIFLGKSKRFPNGNQAVPVNQLEGLVTRDKFNEAICKKNASQYKTYWSQLVFTGKGTPPKDVGDDAAVKAQVAANPKAIGYVDASAVDSSVKVVFKLP